MFNLLLKLFPFHSATAKPPKPTVPKGWPLTKPSDLGFTWLIPGVWGGDHVHWWHIKLERRSACRGDWIYERSEN